MIMVTKKRMLGLAVSLGLMTTIVSAEPPRGLEFAPAITYVPKFRIGESFIYEIVPRVGECMVLKVLEVTEQGVSGKWMAVTCPSLKRKEMP